jgi:hypothetical protein
MRVTIFELAGGLGNQLFQYAAGLAYEAKTGNPVAFDTSVIERSSHNQGRITESFILDGRFVNLNEEYSRLRMILLKTVSQTSKFIPLAAKKLRLNRLVHTSKVTGLDNELYDVPAGAFVRGYFQSHVYSDALRETAAWQGLQIKNPSEWFLKQSARIREIGPNAIHLRRGDYVKLGQIYGLLSPVYYERVLSIANDAEQAKPWVIFSDSIQEADNLKLACASLSNSEVISPPANTPAAESLVLLSLCRTKVIANSTFSLWAATLGDSSASVYAPQPWYRGLEDPDELLPNTWNRVQSSWL